MAITFEKARLVNLNEAVKILWGDGGSGKLLERAKEVGVLTDVKELLKNQRKIPKEWQGYVLIFPAIVENPIPEFPGRYIPALCYCHKVAEWRKFFVLFDRLWGSELCYFRLIQLLSTTSCPCNSTF